MSSDSLRAEDEEAVARVASKNGLESYTYQLKQSVEGDLKEKIEAGDREKLDKAIADTISWLDASAEASKDEYDDKRKELEAVSTPIITKAYGAGGAPPGAEGGFPAGAGGPGGFPGAGADEPSVEEVD